MIWPFAKKPVDPKLHGQTRSPQWDKARREFIKKHPRCAACGSKILPKLQVHHKRPFHLFPELEMVEKNWIVLCEDGPMNTNCHGLLGHCGNWSDYNENVEADAEHQLSMLASRVKG